MQMFISVLIILVSVFKSAIKAGTKNVVMSILGVATAKNLKASLRSVPFVLKTKNLFST